MLPSSEGDSSSLSDLPPPQAADPNATFIPASADTAGKPGDASLPHSHDELSWWLGRKLARYEVKELLGAGGMGVVYRAHDAQIDRDVAIKVLPKSLSSDPVILKRFQVEAKAVGKINNPHAVAIYEIGREGEFHYLVMELVAGGSAWQLIEQGGACSVFEATRITAEACHGLAAAHRVGLVHRDIKPANLLLTLDRVVKVADFGLAKGGGRSSEQVTQFGQVIGTPYFMSPEQCEGSEVDHRSDLYSLGATYYCLLTGGAPYAGEESIIKIMYQQCHGTVPDPRAARIGIPDPCASVVQKAMAKDPAERYQSAEAMLSDLQAILAAMSGTAVALPSQTATHSRAALTATALPPARQRAGVSRRAALLCGAGLAAAAGAGLAWHFLASGRPGERSETGAEPAVAGGPTGLPLRVGVLHSLSGTMATSEAPVVDAVMLAIDEINAAGGLLGRPVEPVIADGHSDAAVFEAEARRLIEQERVATVFGCWTSASRKSVVPIFEEHDHLLLYPVQYEGIEESPNVIYLGAAPNQQIIPAVQWAFAFNGKRRFFLVGSDYVFPRTANAILRDVLDTLGAEIVGEEYLPLGETDVRALVARLVEAGPDVVLNTINGDSNNSFFKELRRAGVTPDRVPTISFSIGEVELRNMDLSKMVGDYAAWNYFQSLESPHNQDFVERFQAKYGKQRVVTDPMEAAYVGVKLWAAAVTDSASDDPAKIRAALRDRRIDAPEGPVRIDPATQHAFKTPRVGKIVASGQFEVVWSAARPEPPQPFPSTRSPEQWKAFVRDLYTGWGNRWSAPAQ